MDKMIKPTAEKSPPRVLHNGLGDATSVANFLCASMSNAMCMGEDDLSPEFIHGLYIVLCALREDLKGLSDVADAQYYSTLRVQARA